MLRFIKRVILSRSFITAVLIILQLLFYAWIINVMADYSMIIHAISYILSVFLSLYILNTKTEPLDIKLPWVVLILLFPIFGSLFYLLFERQRVRKKIRKNIEQQIYSTKKINYDNDLMYIDLKNSDKSAYNQSNYIFKNTNLPIYRNTTCKYFSTGNEYFDELATQFENAKHFIFIEYFIIRPGKVWNRLFTILKKKADEGLDIRVIYDDLGCIASLPVRYKRVLEEQGIKCEVFNPITPIVSFAHNNRDHRKIVVIDGKVAFTGGINIGDEYINIGSKYGYWKDTGVMLQGDAVNSFTLMFLETWHIYRDKDELNDNFLTLTGSSDEVVPASYEIQEYIQPYLSSPMDTEEIVARNVYINLLNSATNYVYITTPYLILDRPLLNAILSAAKRSIDIRIITPHIPDKKYVFAVTRSNYFELIKAGVSIYEYTPGFVHAKNVVCDDKFATIGSINFDNRSFYHSYECGVWIYNSKTVIDMKEDFLNMQSVSQKIYADFQNKIPLKIRLRAGFFRLLSPLL